MAAMIAESRVSILSVSRSIPQVMVLIGPDGFSNFTSAAGGGASVNATSAGMEAGLAGSR